MSYYGRFLAITNRNEPAISVLREAMDMATRYTGPDSAVAIQARVKRRRMISGNSRRPGNDWEKRSQKAAAQRGRRC
jgi:hypothetical protein